MRCRSLLAGGAVLAAAALITGCSSSAGPADPPSSAAQPGTAVPAQAGTSPAAAVIAASMHLPGVIVYTATTDPNNLLGRQGEYTSKVNWGANQDSSIEVFPNTADSEAREQYLSDFKPPFGDGYDYLAGDALLRLSASYTPAQARVLESEFRKAAQ